MKKENVVKLIFFCSVTTFVFFYQTIHDVVISPKIWLTVKFPEVLEHFSKLNDSYAILNSKNNTSSENYLNRLSQSVESVNLKYILLWTLPDNIPFLYLGEGQRGFVERSCRYTNCFVTANRQYFKRTKHMTQFDVVAFHGPEVITMPRSRLPKYRSLHQKYVFASIESAANYPSCNGDVLNNYFNWTWTYKLNSDSLWSYIAIRDVNMTVIGPNKVMHWIKHEDMDPVSDVLKKKLASKTKAVAWFVSNCYTKSRRETFARYIRYALREYNLTVDVFGECGMHSCDPKNETACDTMLEQNYYFYLSFENSLSTDYVTEKLLRPLRYLTVPIVYGGGNYSSFLPEHSYLNAQELGSKRLAKLIDYLIKHPAEYAEYFRWKKYYYYHKRDEYEDTNDYCGFCELLNDEKLMKTTSVYNDFNDWWNNGEDCSENVNGSY